MDFPWLERTAPRNDGSSRREQVARQELVSRAGLLFRLGFSEAEATRRLCQRCAWEFDPSARTDGHHRRPDGLTDEAIGKLVTETYARRPGW